MAVGCMTLKMIKAMFQAGQKWHCVRLPGAPLVVRGNLGVTAMQNAGCDEVRTVSHVGAKSIVFTKPDGKLLYTDLPKASEVVDASPGHLRIRYADYGAEVTLDLLP